MAKRIALLVAGGLVALATVAFASAQVQDRGGADDQDPGAGYPTTTEPAPIDEAEILVLDSYPPQYTVRIVSGLPSGCAEHESTSVERDGDTVRVTVLNTVPASSDVACTMIYGTHEEHVNIGSDFEPGTRYTVEVNEDTVLTFVAE